MGKIAVLDAHTIDKIAAGEVVERPSSVVKELVENAIDAGASVITVEIDHGGKTLIRVTDNGAGIEREQVKVAFLSHATSKIVKVEDLENITSLGFRGEALSSIAAVSKTELITRTGSDLTGTRYVIEGGREQLMEETGAPEGSTFLIRDLFFNVPARRRFLKSDLSEAGDISSLMEQLALSHPSISFRYIQNGQQKLQTNGSGQMKDVIYAVYGRDIARSLYEISYENDFMSVRGYAGKPEISRGNRSFENYFVNGRYVRSGLVTKAIEDAYKGLLMQHRFPFVTLCLSIRGDRVDVNVHPRKMEVRFSEGPQIYDAVYDAVRDALTGREMIPRVEPGRETASNTRLGSPIKPKAPMPVKEEPGVNRVNAPMSVKEEPGANRVKTQMPVQEEPGVKRVKTQMPVKEEPGINRVNASMLVKEEPVIYHATRRDGDQAFITPEVSVQGLHRGILSPNEEKLFSLSEEASDEPNPNDFLNQGDDTQKADTPENRDSGASVLPESMIPPEPVNTPQSVNTPQPVNASQPKNLTHSDNPDQPVNPVRPENPTQLELFEEKLLEPSSRSRHRLIGQLFETYWLVEFENNFYMIDQHAAHEKVYYERFVKQFREQTIQSQYLQPPMVVTLTLEEEVLLQKNRKYFEEFGFEIDSYGGREYCLRAVPVNLYGFTEEELFHELLDRLPAERSKDPLGIFAYRLATMACKAAVKGNSRLSDQEANVLIDELLHLEEPYHCPHGRPTIIAMSRADIEKKFHRIV